MSALRTALAGFDFITVMLDPGVFLRAERNAFREALTEPTPPIVELPARGVLPPGAKARGVKKSAAKKRGRPKGSRNRKSSAQVAATVAGAVINPPAPAASEG